MLNQHKLCPGAAGLHSIASAARLADNPSDSCCPVWRRWARRSTRMAVVPDARSGNLLLWVDTAASLARLGYISAALGLIVGIGVGITPLLRAGLAPFIAGLSLIPPMAILPILFIVLALARFPKWC